MFFQGFINGRLGRSVEPPKLNLLMQRLLLPLLLAGLQTLPQAIAVFPLPSAQAQTRPQPMTPEAAIARLFLTSQIDSQWFSPTFLQAVSVPQIEKIVKEMESALGNYQEVRAEDDQYLTVFERGTVPTRILLDNQGRITGLLFQPPRTEAMSLEDAIAQLQNLPGKTSLLIVQNGTEQTALNADTRLAVGSTFKLAILTALARQIAARQRQWSDVVELQPSWKSLPSGILQGWPEGSPLTLSTLASLMISLSDNTATDALIDVVGRENIEAIAPHNRPFLTTREAFVLKNPENAQLLQRYRQGDVESRRQLLPDLATSPIPNANIFAAEPIAPDIEWYFSTRELCGLMENVASLPLMGINPGLAKPEEWQSVAYKGGSEPGVLNLTTWLEDENGQTYCISATWNHETALEEIRFQLLYKAAIAGIKQQAANRN
jgi:hypothetical protein